MKKNLWLLAAVLCMAACSQNEEIIAEQPTTEDDFESPDGQVVIRLGGGELNASASTTVTRAPITDANFIGTNVGVFALAVNNGTDVAATDWSTAAGALLICPLHCSRRMHMRWCQENLPLQRRNLGSRLLLPRRQQVRLHILWVFSLSSNRRHCNRQPGHSEIHVQWFARHHVEQSRRT